MNMLSRASLVLTILAFVSPGIVLTDSPRSTHHPSDSSYPITTAFLDAGRIWISFNNRGSMNYDSLGEGAFWSKVPGSYTESLVFDEGLWVIGKVNGQIRAGIVQWGSSYSPGPIPGNPQDSLRYRCYKITRGDTTSQDYMQWPADLGAPVDASGKPKISGDQMIWEVYNSADSSVSHLGFRGAPLGLLPVEVRQSAFTRAATGCDSVPLLANVIFQEWVIINKGNAPIESAYVSLWSDIDFGDPEANVPAVDTVDQLGFCWQDHFAQSIPPPRPPAVGYVLLYGPIVPSPGDMGMFMGKPRSGVRNLGMSSFWGILDDSTPDTSFIGPAYSLTSVWNIAHALDKHGEQIIDPTGHVTRFPYSGDPVTGTGWVYSGTFRGGGSGFNLFSGPFTMAPGDTQWVMAALVPGLGRDRFESIEAMRRNAAALRSMSYDSLLQGAFPHTVCEQEILPPTPTLLQNYPDPFNNGATIEYTVPAPSHAVLEIFNVLGQKVATLLNQDKAAGHYWVPFRLTNIASGVYYYRLMTTPVSGGGSSLQTKKMVLLR